MQNNRLFGHTLINYHHAIEHFSSTEVEVIPNEEKLSHLLTLYPLRVIQSALTIYLAVTIFLQCHHRFPKALLPKVRDQSFFSVIAIALVDVWSLLSQVAKEMITKRDDENAFTTSISSLMKTLVSYQPSLMIIHSLLGLLYLRKQTSFIDFSLVPFLIPYLVLSTLLILSVIYPSLGRSLLSSWHLVDTPWPERLHDLKTETVSSDEDTSSSSESQDTKTENTAPVVPVVESDSMLPLSNGQGEAAVNEGKPNQETSTEEESENNKRTNKKRKSKSKKSKDGIDSSNKKRKNNRKSSKKKSTTVLPVQWSKYPLYTLQGLCDGAVFIGEIYFIFFLILKQPPITQTFTALKAIMEGVRIMLILLFCASRIGSLSQLQEAKQITSLF